MHADHLPAFGAGPLVIFVLNKLFNANLFDVLHIFNDTRSILGGVAFFQAGDEHAGKLSALVAKIHLSPQTNFTVLDLAVNAGLRFCLAVQVAARAWFVLPDECTAQAAVQPAGCDQIRISSILSFHSCFDKKLSISSMNARAPLSIFWVKAS